MFERIQNTATKIVEVGQKFVRVLVAGTLVTLTLPGGEAEAANKADCNIACKPNGFIVLSTEETAKLFAKHDIQTPTNGQSCDAAIKKLFVQEKNFITNTVKSRKECLIKEGASDKGTGAEMPIE